MMGLVGSGGWAVLDFWIFERWVVAASLRRCLVEVTHLVRFIFHHQSPSTAVEGSTGTILIAKRTKYCY